MVKNLVTMEMLDAKQGISVEQEVKEGSTLAVSGGAVVDYVKSVLANLTVTPVSAATRNDYY